MDCHQSTVERITDNGAFNPFYTRRVSINVFYAYFEVLNKNRLMETTKFKIVAFAFSEKSRCTKVQIEIHLPNKFWW